MMKEFWDNRYEAREFAYGIAPNDYFKKHIDSLKPGKILLPGDGEGRNGVYAATLGWNVTSFDISEEGKKKAKLLAQLKKVDIEYLINSWEKLELKKESFNAIALIYAHFESEKKLEFHRLMDYLLKPEGYIIFEGFSEGHLQNIQNGISVGGPKELNMLFNKDEVLSYFPNFEISEIEESEIVLHEGIYHKGKSKVIRFVGKKVANIV